MAFLEQIGGFQSDIGAEILTYIPELQEIIVVSGNTQVQVIDVTDPANPVESVPPFDLTDFIPNAASANSIAYSNGLVAIAIAVEPASDPGVVLIVDVAAFTADPSDPGATQVVPAGALPDMVTFTPDGTKVLVANEGEPNADYSIDPEGSISIIDVSGGVGSATVVTAGFEGFNDQIDALRESGVRIFGLNATVAQDVEPEYITVSEGSSTAYVALQENNALAVVDIAAGEVTQILPLGFKDFNQGLETFFFDESELPILADTDAVGEIRLSGFSGLFYEGINPENGNLMFVTHPDRGPDDGARDIDGDGVNDNTRTFLVPDLQPQLVKFELNPTSGELAITDRVFLTDKDGNPLTGLPNLASDDGARIPINEDLEVLPIDPLGADLEGVVRVEDGSYWMVDEYRPAIYHFEANGTLIERYVPAGLPPELGVGALPEVYSTRQDNRGFEAVAYQDGKVYAFVQSPFDNPDSGATATIRILEFDTATETTVGEYLYIQDDIGGGSDKIGDAVALGNGEFLVVERDSGFGVESVKNLYRFSLEGATNVLDLPAGILAPGETLDSLTPEQLAERGIAPVNKEIYADLAELGYGFTDKPEGLASLGDGRFAVLNDNDFGTTGVPIGLGILDLDNALDVSNEDGGINIRNWPVLGMYQPDAIAAYSVNGETYIVTANEGDARIRPDGDLEDADGNVILEEGVIFNEEARVGDVVLDPIAFPNAAEIQLDENLGRLKITTTLGDTDGDGDFDELYAFGARSFSIFNSAGELVYDSGSDFERITATQIPKFFNSDDGLAEEFDERSDDKGPEPEALTLGTINGRTYAFIGLERTGGVMAYEVTDPTVPRFVDYLDFFNGAPGNVAPEGFQFIPAADSPTGQNLLAVASEVSSTVALLAITAPVRISDIQGAAHVSPLVGEDVTAVPGIVTAVDSNGFYLQDPIPDNNDATSEGIFVFTGSTPTVAVGDSILVSGTVSEFTPGGSATRNLSITQIGDVSDVTVLSSGNPLPDATILGEGGRVPPLQIIDNDLPGPYDLLAGEGSFEPDEDGVDFYESLEGMRVTATDLTAVSGTTRFGEIYAVSGENFSNLSNRGTLNIAPDDFNPERIQIDADSGVFDFDFPFIDTGAEIGDVTGVVSYAFGNFEIIPTEDFTGNIVESDLQPEVSEIQAGDGTLTVASYNVLNLDPNDADGDEDIANGRFEAIAQQIVSSLNAPDIVALQEIQDSDGSLITDVVSADATLERLIEALAAAGGPTYEFIDTPGLIPNSTGGQPGGNIRNAFLYNPDRVELVEGSVETLVDPAAILNPDNPFFETRIPLVATFSFNGADVTIVNNHFSSKGGSAPLLGQIQPSVELQDDPEATVNGSLAERIAQAQVVQAFVENILNADADANVIALGDFNEFEFLPPLEILEQSLVNLTETLPPDERYTFIFEGNSQSLDHILISNALTEGAEFDIVHVNSEFADLSTRASDHEPLLVGLDFTPNPNLEGTEGDDVLIGDERDNLIDAFGGDDLVAGELGDDAIFGGDGDDVLRGDLNSRSAQVGEAGGDDLIFGGDGDDRIGGKSGNDILYGDDGDDQIWGDDGDDILYGGFGNDRLVGDNFSGGSGSDIFVLASGEGTDTIIGFEVGVDFIGLMSGVSFGQLTREGNELRFGDEVLAIVNGVNTAELTMESFMQSFA